MDIKSYKFVMQPEQPGNPNDYTPFFPMLHKKQLGNPDEYTSFFSSVAQNATSISTDG